MQGNTIQYMPSTFLARVTVRYQVMMMMMMMMNE